MRRWLFLIALGTVGALIFRRYAFEGIYVASSSMYPTLPVETSYFVNKLSFVFRAPRRGDIVVFTSPVDPEKELIKRVIALPGETIRIVDKKVFIDGMPLKEPYVKYAREKEILTGDNLSETRVPERCYFMLGDNRDESQDSATWKEAKSGARILFVNEEDIKGRLMNVIE